MCAMEEVNRSAWIRLCALTSSTMEQAVQYNTCRLDSIFRSEGSVDFEDILWGNNQNPGPAQRYRSCLVRTLPVGWYRTCICTCQAFLVIDSGYQGPCPEVLVKLSPGWLSKKANFCSKVPVDEDIYMVWK